MQAARAWGLTPRQWDQLAESERAEMVALLRVENGMSAWEAQEAQRRAEEAAKRATEG